ncbi:MAG TPA: hypothetical protein VKD00_07030 [Methyloceanibacter sp.]|nr:hypothetical protein [Methyloceanibacter sp.]
MTLEQALGLEKGDLITHPASAIPREPLPITEVWISDTRQRVRIRVNKIDKTVWLDPVDTGYQLPEPGKVWCEVHKRWEWSVDHRRDHPGYYQPGRPVTRSKKDRGAR